MKKVINNKLFLIVITGIICISVTITADTYLYNSNQVKYTPADSTWNVENVQSAINDLYSKTSNSISGAYVKFWDSNPKDNEHIPVMTTTNMVGELNQYVSSADNMTFTINKHCQAIMVVGVNTYNSTTSGTWSQGAFFINNSIVETYSTSTVSKNLSACKFILKEFNEGDTFNFKTTSSAGWPQQFGYIYFYE